MPHSLPLTNSRKEENKHRYGPIKIIQHKQVKIYIYENGIFGLDGDEHLSGAKENILH